MSKKEEYNLFGKKKKAVAFVDYEYWFYSYKTRFGLTPDPVKWLEDVKLDYELTDIWVFGDFSNPSLTEEVGKIRCITNNIIETGNTFRNKKKDMTDFVMLDYIYRAADENRKVRTYLIFTGDGHFQSVVKYLTEKKKKKVQSGEEKETVPEEEVFAPPENPGALFSTHFLAGKGYHHKKVYGFFMIWRP